MPPALCLTAAAVLLALADASSTSDGDARYRHLWRLRHRGLDGVRDDIGGTHLEYDNRPEIGADQVRAALGAAFQAADPYFDRRSEHIVSALAQRCGLADVQRRVNAYLDRAVEKTADTNVAHLVRAHRSWRIVTNIVSDVLALVLERYPTSAAYVDHAKAVMDVVGRNAFVTPLLAARDAHPLEIENVDDPDESIRQLRERGLSAHVQAAFEQQFPKVVKAGDFHTVIAMMAQGLARLWWTGPLRPKRVRLTFEQFVLGLGLSIADAALAADRTWGTRLLSGDPLPDTTEFDRMFDLLLAGVRVDLARHLGEDVPNKGHLVSIVMEMFNDLDRPRYLLTWLSASDADQ